PARRSQPAWPQGRRARAPAPSRQRSAAAQAERTREKTAAEDHGCRSRDRPHHRHHRQGRRRAGATRSVPARSGKGSTTREGTKRRRRGAAAGRGAVARAEHGARDGPVIAMAAADDSVRKRPAALRALGDRDPPHEVTVGHQIITLERIVKHDSWAATAIYRDAAGRSIVCKFNRVQPLFVIPLSWIGRALARREAGFLRQLADVELVPKDLGDVVADGRVLPNAIARTYIDGEVLLLTETITPRFFDELRDLLRAIHAHDIAYVDLHKRENVIVSRDGRPYLIDFQVCFGLS